MALYESVFIARQDISSAQAEALTEQFAQIIGENGGTVSKKEYWGLKSLAFRIKKNRKGHYVLLNIDAPPAAVIEMERNMRISEDVIRYLTVKVEQLEETPSAMLQGRDRADRERGDRDRDRDRPRYRDDDRPPREDRAPREGAPE
jgi:small subunit ribosomal protein S6